MIKTGFIGLGRMGLTHFSILNTHPSIKNVAVCDQSSTMLNILSKFVDVQTYTDYSKMLRETELDCAIVSTPADSHAEIARACLEKGLHVFVEKPLTMTSAEGETVMAALGQKPLVNQVGYVNRFNDVFMEVKRLVDNNLIGEVVNFSSEMFGPTVLKDSKSSWRGNKKKGGGCMYEFASHCIDLVVYLLDRPDRVVGSILQGIYSSEVEDLVSSTFIYNKGFSGTVSVNWSDETYRKPANIIKILGTKGKIVADKHAYKLYLKKASPENGFDKGWNTRYITDFAESVRFYLRGNEFTRQLDHFVDCIENQSKENQSSFAEGFKTDVLMEEITKDAAKSITPDSVPSVGSPILLRQDESPSLWRKLIGEKVTKHA